MSNQREIKEGMQYMGADEQLYFSLTTTPWGSTPTNTAAKIYEVAGDTYTDKTSTLMSGSTSVTGDVITLPKITGLTAGTLYRVEVAFTCTSNVFEAVAFIRAER